MKMVTNEIRKFGKKYEERLLHHVNVEATQLLDNKELVRRLKKKKRKRKKNFRAECNEN